MPRKKTTKVVDVTVEEEVQVKGKEPEEPEEPTEPTEPTEPAELEEPAEPVSSDMVGDTPLAFGVVEEHKEHKEDELLNVADEADKEKDEQAKKELEERKALNLLDLSRENPQSFAIKLNLPPITKGGKSIRITATPNLISAVWEYIMTVIPIIADNKEEEFAGLLAGKNQTSVLRVFMESKDELEHLEKFYYASAITTEILSVFENNKPLEKNKFKAALESYQKSTLNLAIAHLQAQLPVLKEKEQWLPSYDRRFNGIIAFMKEIAGQ